jgi:hypothetical protein
LDQFRTTTEWQTTPHLASEIDGKYCLKIKPEKEEKRKTIRFQNLNQSKSKSKSRPKPTISIPIPNPKQRKLKTNSAFLKNRKEETKIRRTQHGCEGPRVVEPDLPRTASVQHHMRVEGVAHNDVAAIEPQHSACQ